MVAHAHDLWPVVARVVSALTATWPITVAAFIRPPFSATLLTGTILAWPLLPRTVLAGAGLAALFFAGFVVTRLEIGRAHV